MSQSTHNPYLLYKSDPFCIVSLQNNDMLLLAETYFADAKENIIKSAKLMSKDRDHLTIDKRIKFNDALIDLTSNDNLTVKQET